jgi:hypothetical protein
MVGLALDRVALGVGDRHAARVDRHQLVVLDHQGAPGLGEERGDRGGDEVLAFAQADHQRAFLARRHQAVGVL